MTKYEFSVNNSYNSNAIEGNTLTKNEVKHLVSKNKETPTRYLVETNNKSKNHNIDILGYFEILYDFLKYPNLYSTTEYNILTIHSYALINNEKENGKYRTVPVSIGNHNGEEPYLIRSKVLNLIDWFNKDKDYEPINRIALFHLKFETIHPFLDGNGRTGRIIMILQLYQQLNKVVDITIDDKTEYYKCFDEYRKNNNIQPMVDLINKKLISLD